MKRIGLLLIVSALWGHARWHDRVVAPAAHRSWIEIKNAHLVRQHHDYSCGSASLATILRYYYHRNVTEKEILESIKKRKGITDKNLQQMIEAGKADLSFLDLSEYASTQGFHTVALALDMEALGQLKLPVIIYIEPHGLGHFSVYKGMDKRMVYLADPSFGNIAMRRSRFQKLFYKRKDAEYPGKILALLPDNEAITPDALFLKKPRKSKIIYETIRSRAMKR